MRLGNVAASIPDGVEDASGYVVLGHGQQYAIRLDNFGDRRVDAEVKIDGKGMGTYRLEPNGRATLERSSHDEGRFTFFASESAEASVAGVHAVAVPDRGLVQVTFRFERQPDVLQRLAMEKTSSPLGAGVRSRAVDALPTSTRSGITGLTGKSSQRFTTVGPMAYDPALETVITLRLVADALHSAVRELRPAPMANPVPVPVA